jgi:hypothetical protein
MMNGGKEGEQDDRYHPDNQSSRKSVVSTKQWRFDRQKTFKRHRDDQPAIANASTSKNISMGVRALFDNVYTHNFVVH